MTPAVKKALEYARTHLQGVRIVWVDREPEICSAEEAVELCSYGHSAGRIVAAVAQDEKFTQMLNGLIDAW